MGECSAEKPMGPNKELNPAKKGLLISAWRANANHIEISKRETD